MNSIFLEQCKDKKIYEMNESDTSLLWTLSQQFQFPQGDLGLSDDVWDNILRSRRPEKVL